MSPPGQHVQHLLSAASDRRRAIAPKIRLTAYRVLNGPGDGAAPGLAVDRYADGAIVHARVGVSNADVASMVEAVGAVLDPTFLVLKRWAPRINDSTSEVVRGSVPAEVIVYEDDAAFVCDVDDGVHTGLFLDHRDTRFVVRRLAAGREVLNTFAYTGSFGVHAALAGAARVTNVDVSRRALARGRANMTASGIDANDHRWFDDDVLAHLGRGAGGAYDVIVLDPPLFGRTKKRVFSLLQDVDALLFGAVRKLRPHGHLVFSTHALELTEERMFSAVLGASQGRPVEVVERLGLPVWDHPTVADASGEDRGDYLKTLVLRFD